MKRSGFTILEMIFTLSLVMVGMTLSSKMLCSVLRSQTRLGTASYQASVLDRAVHRLRTDAESSTTLQTSAETVELSDVRWQADAAGLTRVSATRQERFELPAAAHLSTSGDAIVLNIGDAIWTLPAPLLVKGNR